MSHWPFTPLYCFFVNSAKYSIPVGAMCRLAQITTTNSCWHHNQHIPIRYPRHHTRPLNIGWGLWLPTLNKYDAVSVVWTPDMGLKIPNGERTGLYWQLEVRERLSWVYNHTVRECINRRVYTFPTVAMLERSIRNIFGVLQIFVFV